MLDHFAMLGVTRRFTLDNAALERRFHLLQRETHPDRFAGADSDAAEEALQRSSSINLAYRTLRDPMSRTKHLLALYGLSVEQTKQVPMELLEIVMNVQEKVAELEFADEASKEKKLAEIEPIRDDLAARRTGIDRRIEEAKRKWDALDCPAEFDHLSADEKELLTGIARSLAERAYITTLLDTLERASKGESMVLKH